MKRLAGILLLFTVLLTGCDLLNADTLAPAEARIVPGRGIDGIHFGDSKEREGTGLGSPASEVRAAYGAPKAAHEMTYSVEGQDACI